MRIQSKNSITVKVTLPSRIVKALNQFKAHGGILKMSEAISLKINPRTIYDMRGRHLIESVSRGIYQLINQPLSEHQDLVVVAKRLPRGIVCVISALSFHGLTTQIPHEVQIAYQQGWREPKLDYPPIRVFRYTKKAYNIGIEHHKINNVTIHIYSAAKTVVDSFKFRNKIGLNVAIEALKLFLADRTRTVDELIKYAHICRVEKIMNPYIEAIINE